MSAQTYIYKINTNMFLQKRFSVTVDDQQNMLFSLKLFSVDSMFCVLST